MAAGDDPRIVGAAPLASPTFTGNPQAPTPTAGDNDQSIATTQFVHDAVAAGIATVPAPVAATAAEYVANSAPGKMLTPGAAWGAGPFFSLTDGPTVTPDMSLGVNFYWTVGGANRTLGNPINSSKAGQCGIIMIAQDATGGRTITGWGNQFFFPGGVRPVLSTAPNAFDIISYFYTGGAYFCTFNAGFA